MLRPSVVVRAATSADMADLLAMWTQARGLGRPTGPCPSEQAVLARLEIARTNPGVRVVVGVVDDQVAGMAVLLHEHQPMLFEPASVQIGFLHVREGCRRRGVGRALIAAATSFADEVDAEHLGTSVGPTQRETNRFFARLGFAPVVVRRTSTVAAVRRRLAAEAGATPLDELLARRRSVRSRNRLRALANLVD